MESKYGEYERSSWPITPVNVALKLSLMIMTMFLGASNVSGALNLRKVGAIELTNVSSSEQMKCWFFAMSSCTFWSSKGNMSPCVLWTMLYVLTKVYAPLLAAWFSMTREENVVSLQKGGP